MKAYKLEIAAVLMQFAIFYLLPPIAIKLGPIMMVMIMLVASGTVSAFLGCWSNSRIKYLFPLAAALLFLPSVPMYYNSSAIVHVLWYLVITAVGMGFGALIHKIRG